jgi:hypothetical protein
MAKGAAKEAALGGLHAQITNVFSKVMARYEQRLDALEAPDLENIQADLLEELFDDAALPNPAMLGAITKFLKDNTIDFDNEQVEALSDQERRLADRRKNRGNVVGLTTLKAVDGG